MLWLICVFAGHIGWFCHALALFYFWIHVEAPVNLFRASPYEHGYLSHRRTAKAQSVCTQYEPPHDKTNKMTVCPAKTQITWAPAQSDQSSLCTQWVAKNPSFLHADSEDSDQTGQMPRLIWVFAGYTVILLVLSWGGSYIELKEASEKEQHLWPYWVAWHASSKNLNGPVSHEMAVNHFYGNYFSSFVGNFMMMNVFVSCLIDYF